MINFKLKDRPALILIDIQKAFEDLPYWGGERNNPDAEKNAGRILNFWRAHQLPIYHVKHCSTNKNSPLVEGKPGNQFQDVVAPKHGEIVIKKNVNSAFIGTDLKEQLDQEEISVLVIVGLTTDHCVSTTTRMAGNYGFDTFLVADAVATFSKKGINGEMYSAELMHNTALASLNEEFAKIVNTEQVIRLFDK